MNIIRIALSLFAVAVISACNMKPTSLTQENLDKIHEDMTSAQVKAILGSPTDSKSEPIPVVGGTKTTYIYTNDEDSVTIVLKNDTVQSKEGHFAEPK